MMTQGVTSNFPVAVIQTESLAMVMLPTPYLRVPSASYTLPKGTYRRVSRRVLTKSLPLEIFVEEDLIFLICFAGGNEEFCCDGKQIDLLSAQMTLPRQLLARCPSCLTNFVQLWCDFTCSPEQGNFVRIKTTEDDSYTVYVMNLLHLSK